MATLAGDLAPTEPLPTTECGAAGSCLPSEARRFNGDVGVQPRRRIAVNRLRSRFHHKQRQRPQEHGLAAAAFAETPAASAHDRGHCLHRVSFPPNAASRGDVGSPCSAALWGQTRNRARAGDGRRCSDTARLLCWHAARCHGIAGRRCNPPSVFVGGRQWTTCVGRRDRGTVQQRARIGAWARGVCLSAPRVRGAALLGSMVVPVSWWPLLLEVEPRFAVGSRAALAGAGTSKCSHEHRAHRCRRLRKTSAGGPPSQSRHTVATQLRM
jgi:hypothetical protein